MWERAVTKMNILWGQLLANLKKDEKERDRKYKKEVMHLLRPQRFRGNNEVHNGGEGESVLHGGYGLNGCARNSGSPAAPSHPEPPPPPAPPPPPPPASPPRT